MEICQRLLNSYDTHIDEFFSEIDSTVATSQTVFQQLDQKLGPLIGEIEWEKIQLQVGFKNRKSSNLSLLNFDFFNK